MELTPLENWLPTNNKPLLIAGPCSAETEEQVRETTDQLAATGKVSAFRAGIWKPRTRPGAFEGIGEEGLPWLIAAGKKHNLPVTAEVANTQHVDIALKAGVDVLWVGARTTVNPFSVQEIADALKGVDIPVMVKNPVNPDIGLWVGALERFHRSGITKLAAIHRGFSPIEKTPFRNAPMWRIAIDLKRKIPGIPMICDPSHIAGDRTLISAISQRALDLDMQGLMIETHRDPDNAWTDAKQQVTPAALEMIVDSLVIRESQISDPAFENVLEQLRQDIDLIDERIIQILAERMKLVEQIGNYKRDNGVTILQVQRWDEILSKRTQLGTALNLKKEFVKKMLELVHSESIRKQNEIMNAKTEVTK